MKCCACQSDQVQLIKVFAGHNPMGWAPVGGEKDIFGNYKKLRPLLAHACTDCGAVNWSIKVPKEQDPDKTAEALDELAREDLVLDPGEESAAYSFEGLEDEID